MIDDKLELETIWHVFSLNDGLKMAHPNGSHDFISCHLLSFELAIEHDVSGPISAHKTVLYLYDGYRFILFDKNGRTMKKIEKDLGKDIYSGMNFVKGLFGRNESNL
jgi:hypothetical protein